MEENEIYDNLEEEKKVSSSVYGVKLDIETKEELINYIKQHEGTAGDFVRILLDVYKTNVIADKVIDNKGDIRELNSLISRVYDIYANMINKSDNLLTDLQRQAAEKLEEKNELVQKLQDKLSSMHEQLVLASDDIKNLEQHKKELTEKVENLKVTIYKDSKYVEKLELELLELKGIKEENKNLETELKSKEKEIKSYESRVSEYKNNITDLQSKLVQKEKEKEDIKVKAKQDLEYQKSKLEMENKKSIYDIENMYREKLEELRLRKNTELDELQDKYVKMLAKTEQLRDELHEAYLRLDESKKK